MKPAAVTGAIRLGMIPSFCFKSLRAYIKEYAFRLNPKIRSAYFKSPITTTTAASMRAIFFETPFAKSQAEHPVKIKAIAVSGFMATGGKKKVLNATMSSCQPANTATAIEIRATVRYRDHLRSS